MHTNGMQIIAKSPAKCMVGENHPRKSLTHTIKRNKLRQMSPVNKISGEDVLIKSLVMMLMGKFFFLNYHSYISTVFDHQYDILISAWGCAIRSDMLKFGTPNFVKNVSDTVLWNGETEKRKESYYNGHLRNTWRWSWLCRNKVLQGMVKWNDTYVSVFKLLLIGTEKEIFKINKMEKSLCHIKDIAKRYSKQFSFC